MFQQTFKNFTVNFNALNERNTCSSGNLLTGQVCFDLTKETKITSITLRLTGNANVHWKKKRRKRGHFSPELEFFDIKSAVVQENSATGDAAKLQPGAHEYQFACQLPEGNFPSSFRGVHGAIEYSVTVGIDRPWHLTKDFVTELNFVHHIDTESPELHAPLVDTNSMTLCCLWCASGPISMTARVEKKAFVPGETVKITCNLSNASSRTATPKASLVQTQTFYTTKGVCRREVVTKLASASGKPIRGQNTVTTEIMLTFPSAIPLTISNCSIIVVEYIIQVRFGVRWSPDVTVLFPIIIHGGPVPAQPQSYNGNLLTGQICFDLTKETKITSITLRLTGKANVHWTSGSRKHRRVYSAKLEFFDIKSAIVQENSAIRGAAKLQPGAHEYQFACQLPEGNFPSSFRGAHGAIVYSVTVGIDRPWHRTKDFVTELNFVHHIDTDPPELHAPLVDTNSMTLCCLWCASDPISVTAHLEKKAFVPGETVKITCNLSNASSRTATPKAILVQKQTFYTTKGVCRREVVTKLASVSGEPIRGQNTVTTEIMLTIPSTAPLTISNCSIIVVEYIIQVNFGVRGSPDVTVLFPIIIHGGPVLAQPLSYM